MTAFMWIGVIWVAVMAVLLILLLVLCCIDWAVGRPAIWMDDPYDLPPPEAKPLPPDMVSNIVQLKARNRPPAC